jgi:hypothetical protein
LNFLLDLRDSIEGLNVEGDCFFFQVNVVEFWCICLVFRSRNPLIGQTRRRKRNAANQDITF